MSDRTDQIMKQIDNLFGDTSVPVQTTIDDLMEIRDQCENLIESCEADL